MQPKPTDSDPKNCDPLNLAKGYCSDSDSNVCDSTNIAKGSCKQPNLPDNDSNCDLNNFKILDCNATPDYDSKSDTKCNTDIDINDTKCNPKNESNSSDSDNDIENLSPDKKIEYYSKKLIEAVEENPNPTKIFLMIKNCNLNIDWNLSGSTPSR